MVPPRSVIVALVALWVLVGVFVVRGFGASGVAPAAPTAGCPAECRQAVATAEYRAIVALDCDGDVDQPTVNGQVCTDEWNDVNVRPHVRRVVADPAGGFIVTLSVRETTGITDWFRVRVTPAGGVREPVDVWGTNPRG